jgi:uncharacterized protein YceH (UPF0502 family)
MQLFSGEAPAVDVARTPSRVSDLAAHPTVDRISSLENEILELKRQVSEIQQQLSAFCKQFE